MKTVFVDFYFSSAIILLFTFILIICCDIASNVVKFLLCLGFRGSGPRVQGAGLRGSEFRRIS